MSIARIFVIPALVAVFSLLGLVVALVGDGWWDWLSWAALAVPLGVAAQAWRKRTD